MKNVSEPPRISPTTVRRIRGTLDFSYLPPITTFPLNIAERAARVAFATQQLGDQIANKLVDSIPKRFEEVMTNKGGHISY
jgi:hypothetical protein